jgi:iron complex transport system permease protein
MIARLHKKVFYAILIILPLAIVFTALFIGRYPLSIGKVLSILAMRSSDSITDIENAVVWDVRLPRAVTGAIIGAALAASGAALQGVFKNPLVDSGILGVSSGAGFGAVFAIILFNGLNAFTFMFAFAFGILAVLLSVWIAKVHDRTPSIMLVLGGVIVSSVFSALISLGKYVADPYNELPAITFWLMGSLANSNFKELGLVILPIGIGIIGIFLLRWRVNVLSLGERDAKTLGIDLNANRGALILFTTLATAGSVCISGTIGWIGLIIPHVGRMIVGNDNKILIPVSMSLGAFFMVFIDILSRSITSGEIPLGILTAITGAPFYVYILKKTKGGGW